jgi:AbiV family abortive infection protein
MIPRAVLVDGVPAALQDAQRLLADAETLHAHSSTPTAQAMAVLALEEAVKAFIWIRLLVDQPNRAVIMLSDENHGPRLQTARHLEILLETLEQFILEVLGVLGGESKAESVSSDTQWSAGDLQDILAAAAKDDNLAKMRGLHVDAEPDGLRVPIKEVTDEDDAAWIKRATTLIAVVAFVESTTPPSA